MTSELGAPPGSLRYFAVLFAPPAARPVLEALYDFDAEVRKTVAASSHEAAHARLAWWRGEIDRLAAGRPTHPIATALLPLRGRGDADLALLHENLVAADLDLARLTYQTQEELEAYCYRASGALQTLAAAWLAGERAVSEAERTFARRLGSATRQVEMIRDLRHNLRQGRFYVPVADIDAARLDPTRLAQSVDGEPFAALVADWRARVAESLRSLPGTLPEPSQRAAQRHGLVLGALHEKLLRGAPRVDVGPLTKLWTAWRTAVRHA